MPSAFAGLDVICELCVVNLWVTAALVLAIAALVLWRLRRRRHPVVRWFTCSVAVLLAVLLAAADSVNAYYAYLPTVGDAVQAATGDRQWIHLTALVHPRPATLQRADRSGLVIRLPVPADPRDDFPATTAIAYLPPQYFTDRTATFPVAYLFHGSPGEAADWFHAGRAEFDGQLVAARGKPTIIVAPPMSRSWTDDPECVDGAKEKVEAHLFGDVIPDVDSTLRTQPDRTGRIFAGMSAGGYCALNLGLRHRDAVGTIIDMSGDTDPTHTGGAISLFGRHTPGAAADVVANSPADYAASLRPQPPMRIWLDSGTGDTDIVHEMSSLDQTLSQRGFDVVWRVRPGGHTYWVWTAAMREALPWALGLPAKGGHSRSRPGPT